jgi:hypothetical protein
MYRINHGAVIVTIILHQIVRYLWYSPSVFFDPWMSAFRLTPLAMTDLTLVPFIAALLASVSFCYLFAWLINRLMITRLLEGLALAVALWLPHAGFLTMSQYLSAEIPWPGILVDVLGTLANVILSGVILTLWRKRARSGGAPAEEQSRG